MKIEYTPTHHRREHNASETTQAPFLATHLGHFSFPCQSVEDL